MSMMVRRGIFERRRLRRTQGHWPGHTDKVQLSMNRLSRPETNSNYVANAELQGQGRITGGAAVVRYSSDYKILGKRNST